MPTNKTEMPKAGQYIYLVNKRKTQLPVVAKVKLVHSLQRVRCITSVGIVDVARCDFALTKEEAIQKVSAALDKKIAAAQQRISEAQKLKEALNEMPELPPADTAFVSHTA